MPQTQIRRLPLQSRPGLLHHISRFFRLAAARRRDRVKLAHLDQRLLRDIGIDDVAAAEECAKPFWRS